MFMCMSVVVLITFIYPSVIASSLVTMHSSMVVYRYLNIRGQNSHITQNVTVEIMDTLFQWNGHDRNNSDNNYAGLGGGIHITFKPLDSLSIDIIRLYRDWKRMRKKYSCVLRSRFRKFTVYCMLLSNASAYYMADKETRFLCNFACLFLGNQTLSYQNRHTIHNYNLITSY